MQSLSELSIATLLLTTAVEHYTHPGSPPRPSFRLVFRGYRNRHARTCALCLSARIYCSKLSHRKMMRVFPGVLRGLGSGVRSHRSLQTRLGVLLPRRRIIQPVSLLPGEMDIGHSHAVRDRMCSVISYLWTAAVYICCIRRTSYSSSNRSVHYFAPFHPWPHFYSTGE